MPDGQGCSSPFTGAFVIIQHMKAMKRMICGVVLVLSGLFMGVIAEAQEKDKISIGILEDVVLLPWGVKIPARIDTGAAVTSLDARDLVIKDDVAEFRLPEKYGGTKISLPVVRWRDVRSAGGQQRRPVVEMRICVGPKVIRTKVNLIDRSRMSYPMIIGRNVLRRGYVVDCLCANILKPSCPEVEQK